MATKQKLPLEQKDDTPEMVEAIRSGKAAGLNLKRCSVHQLKSGRVNFWPATGRIYIDQGPKVSERGLAAFIRLATIEHNEASAINTITL